MLPDKIHISQPVLFNEKPSENQNMEVRVSMQDPLWKSSKQIISQEAFGALICLCDEGREKQNPNESGKNILIILTKMNQRNHMPPFSHHHYLQLELVHHSLVKKKNKN